MTGDHFHIVSVEDGQEHGLVGIGPVQFFLPAQTVGNGHGLVGGNYDQGGLVHIRKVGPEPFKFIGREVLPVLAAVVLAGIHAGEVHVVQDDEVYLAQVE